MMLSLIEVIIILVISGGNKGIKWLISGVNNVVIKFAVIVVLNIFSRLIFGFILMVIIGVIAVKVIDIIIGRWIFIKRLILIYCNNVMILQ